MSTLQRSRSPRLIDGELRRGSMLAELVIAITVSAILLVGIQSALSMALRSVPDAQSGSGSFLEASRIADRLTTELETAVYITDYSATSIGFTVADRNGDGIDERVRYHWSGTAGTPLTRQYNGGTAEPLAEHVQQFSLTPFSKSFLETYPALGVEDSSESLLVDRSSATGLGNSDLTSSSLLGQYFRPTLPAGAVAWRPTRVQFVSKKADLLGSSIVQLRLGTNSLSPSSTTLQQFSLTESLLSLGYDWQTFNLTQAGGLASSASVALVVLPSQGTKPLTAQTTSAFSGMLRSSNGTSWTHDNGKALVSRLYGKFTRSSGTVAIHPSNLTSTDIALTLGNNAPTARTVAAFLNRPELLTGKWELKFDENPTQTEINGDGTSDWSTGDGSAFDVGSLTTGAWRTSGILLKTNPGSDFAKTTVVDLEFQNLATGGSGAIFRMNALRSGSQCAPVLVNLARQADGTQTLTLQAKSNDALTKNLLIIPGLASQLVTLHLVVHPADASVSLKVNDIDYGTYPLIRFASTDSGRSAIIGAEGSMAEFAYARVRVLED